MGDESRAAERSSRGYGSVSGPDRSRVSSQQESNHQAAMNRARDSQQYDYSGPKQIVKQTAVNTAKNLARNKVMNTLGLAKFSNPIGIQWH